MRIKIEEKRIIPNAPKPYCVQMIVNRNNGFDVPIPQATATIDEFEPPMVNVAKRDTPGSLTLAARDSPEIPCYCVLMSG